MAEDKQQFFRDHLAEFTQRKFNVNIAKIAGLEQSKKMALFYIEDVINRVEPQLIPEDPEDLMRGLIDGSGDHGVDFICRQNDSVFVIQCKYHTKKSDPKPDEFSHFRQVLARLYHVQKSKAHERLLEAVQDIDWEKDRFILHFITLSKVNASMRADEGHGVSPMPELPDLLERTELLLLDETDLNRKLRDALSATESMSVPIPVKFIPNEDQKPWLHFEHEGRASYVGRISGSQLFELYKPNQIRNRLFFRNIRNYVGNTATNKGIETTALSDADNFFFFNNGLSAVATNIEEHPEDNTLTCRRFSIVNGAQTVRSLYKAGLKGEKAGIALRKIQVLLRISEVSNKTTVPEGQFLENITKYNNTQNEIKISDFRSNDLVQNQISKYFGKVHYRGKPVWYKNKRIADVDRNKYAIGMEEFTKTVFSFLFGPDDMYGGTKFLFDPGPEGGYQQVFGKGGDESTFTDKEFNNLAGIWFICTEARIIC